MDFDKTQFVNLLMKGNLLPTETEKTYDSSGPLMILKFPEYRVAIHIHFSDQGKYEQTGRSHIKSYDGKVLDLIDAYQIAIIRMHIEQYEHEQRVSRVIEAAALSADLEPIETNDSFITMCYSKKRVKYLISPLLCVVYNNSPANNDIDSIIEYARRWTKANAYKRNWLTSNPASLFLIILHKGNIGPYHIKGKCDRSAFHNACIRDIAAVDIYKNHVDIEEISGLRAITFERKVFRTVAKQLIEGFHSLEEANRSYD